MNGIEINLVVTSKRINFAARSGLERVLIAGVAELVDALDLGSSGKSRVGSSPIARTNKGGLSVTFIRTGDRTRGL